MAFGICLQNFIPVRLNPDETSEMVTQVLYGEIFEVLEEAKSNKFSRISMTYDEYEGWIDKKTIFRLEDEQKQRISELEEFVTSSLYTPFILNDGSRFMLGAGSTVYRNNKTIVYPEEIISADANLEISQISVRNGIRINSLAWEKIPYLWGGRSVFGTDCSGFVQNIFKQAGIKLPRDSQEQVKIGITRNFDSETKAGDLAFFENKEGQISHVGILLGNGKIIHASGQVRIDLFDHQGIFSEDLADYTHTLRVIKNVLKD